MGDLGRATDLLEPVMASPLSSEVTPAELIEAERLIASATASLRLADPDRPMSPEETLELLKGRTVRWTTPQAARTRERRRLENF